MIDLGTRRRLRINGHLSSSEGKNLCVEVEESFAQLPKIYPAARCTSVFPSGGYRKPSARSVVTRSSDHKRKNFFAAQTHSSWPQPIPARARHLASRRKPRICRDNGRNDTPHPRLPGQQHVQHNRQFAGGSQGRPCRSRFQWAQIHSDDWRAKVLWAKPTRQMWYRPFMDISLRRNQASADAGRPPISFHRLFAIQSADRARPDQFPL